MKKMIALLMTLVLVSGICAAAFAETGFETIYGMYCDEKVLGQPWAVYEMGEDAQTEKILFAIFMFDPDNDMTMAVLIGADAEGANKYYTWGTGYETGAILMTFMLSQFEGLKATCDEGVDFCIGYSFDGGETMTEITTVEQAEQLTAILQQDAAEKQGDTESAETVQENPDSKK